MTSMAKVLLVGSHPIVTAHVAKLLRRAGWSTVEAVGAREGLEAIAAQEVDLLVLGGPEALAARDTLTAALKAHHPWAVVVVPEGPMRVVAAVASAFGEAH